MELHDSAIKIYGRLENASNDNIISLSSQVADPEFNYSNLKTGTEVKISGDLQSNINSYLSDSKQKNIRTSGGLIISNSGYYDYLSLSLDDVIQTGNGLVFNKLSNDVNYKLSLALKDILHVTGGLVLDQSDDETYILTLELDNSLFIVITGDELPPNPEVGKENKIYLLKNNDSPDNTNLFSEYLWVDEKWEKLGEVGVDIDLSDYAKIEALAPWQNGSGYYSVQIPESEAQAGYSIAEGFKTIAEGIYSHTEGDQTYAKGPGSHAEGNLTKTFGISSHGEGGETTAYGQYSHTEGYETEAGDNNYKNGADSTDKNDVSMGFASHAEGYKTKAIAGYSHSEGGETTAYGCFSHVEGYKSVVGNNDNLNNLGGSLIESSLDGQVIGFASHVEGYESHAEGANSHAEGRKTYAEGMASHAEGHNTNAEGNYSHAEGDDSHSKGQASHTEGIGNITYNSAEHASGRYNDSTESSDIKEATLFSVGNGDDDEHRHNAFEIKRNGTILVQNISPRKNYLEEDQIDLQQRLNMWHNGSTSDSLIGGTNNQANNKCETAIGFNNVSNGNGTSFADFGSYNNTLFSIGNGNPNTGTIRHNAFEVRQDGTILIADTSKIGITENSKTYNYSDTPQINLQEKLITKAEGPLTIINNTIKHNKPTESISNINNNPIMPLAVGGEDAVMPNVLKHADSVDYITINKDDYGHIISLEKQSKKIYDYFFKNIIDADTTTNNTCSINIGNDNYYNTFIIKSNSIYGNNMNLYSDYNIELTGPINADGNIFADNIRGKCIKIIFINNDTLSIPGSSGTQPTKIIKWVWNLGGVNKKPIIFINQSENVLYNNGETISYVKGQTSIEFNIIFTGNEIEKEDRGVDNVIISSNIM